MRSSGSSSIGSSFRLLRWMNSSKQSVAMTAIVGTVTSKPEKCHVATACASRSLMTTRLPALPPSDPVPMRVKRNVPSQKLRSKTGRSATGSLVSTMLTPVDTRPRGRASLMLTAMPLHPTALLTRFRNAADGNSVCGVAHVEILAASQLGNRIVRRRHLHVELAEHFILLPEVIHVALHLLEVAAGNSAGVGQKVGEQQNVMLANLDVGFKRCRPVRALRDDSHLRANLVDVVGGDLVLDCS